MIERKWIKIVIFWDDGVQQTITREALEKFKSVAPEIARMLLEAAK